MSRGQRLGMTCLLAALGLGLAGTTWAGPYVNLMQPCDCPPNHYSALHYISPVFYRWAAWCQGPCRYTFARVLHPDIATTYYLKRYHCPSVNPLQFSVQNYPGLTGSPPVSTYQSPSQMAQAPRATPPQELPPPREEKLQKPETLPLPTPEKKD